MAMKISGGYTVFKIWIIMCSARKKLIQYGHLKFHEFLDLKNGWVQIFRLIFQFLNKKKFFCADQPILGKFSIDFGNAQIFATPFDKNDDKSRTRLIQRLKFW